MMKSLPTIVVPARLASTRFPRKLLADAGGIPLILRTAQRLEQEAPEYEKFFAVDGEELNEVLCGAGYNTILTNPDLPSGTDRIAEANEILGREQIINVQADEPMVRREHIDALSASLLNTGADLGTLAVAFESAADFLDPNQVKVVVGTSGFALYFSRLPIPCHRDGEVTNYFDQNFAYQPLKHMGMYAYTASFLKSFACSNQTILEKLESLEQLRALELGFSIAVSVVSSGSIGIDSPEDMGRINF
jgi:3-deoxy-manno-octulosonate cytidylyltransferase (CMP-KDO synthetase)